MVVLRRIRVPLLVLAFAAFMLLSAGRTQASGETYIVNDNADPPNGYRSCPGDCSLRQAIFQANTHPGPDTILFDQTVFSDDAHQYLNIDSDMLPIDASQGITIDGGRYIFLSGHNVTLNWGLVFESQPGADIQNVTLKHFIGDASHFDGIQFCAGIDTVHGTCGGAALHDVTLDHSDGFENDLAGIRILASSISNLSLVDSHASSVTDGPGVLIQAYSGPITNLSITSTGDGRADDDGDRGIDIEADSADASQYNDINGLTIHGEETSHDGAPGIEVVGGNVQNVTIDGITSEHNSFAGARITYTQSAHNVAVTNSTFTSDLEGPVLRSLTLGAQAADGVHISGNTITNNSTGIEVATNGALTNSIIENNVVQTNTQSPQYGIRLRNNGTTAGGNNIVRGNTVTGQLTGINVNGPYHTTISRNSFHDNVGLGIDLQATGDSANTVTQNDPGDADSGPNDLLNFPVIGSVTPQEMTGTACANCLVELFRAAPDPTGFGEGQTFLRDAMTDGAGNFTISLCELDLPVGASLTTTATANLGNTSEFSVNAGLQQPTDTTCTVPTDTPSPTPSRSPTPTPTPSPTGSTATPIAGNHKEGDLDCSGSVNGKDALYPIRYSAGVSFGVAPGSCPQPTDGDPDFYDVTCDGNIGPGDTLALLQFAGHIPIKPPQPGGCTPVGQTIN